MHHSGDVGGLGRDRSLPVVKLTRSADRQHQMLVLRTMPHDVGLRWVCLRVAWITIQHLAPEPTIITCAPVLIQLLPGSSFVAYGSVLLAPPSPRSMYMNPTYWPPALLVHSGHPPFHRVLIAAHRVWVGRIGVTWHARPLPALNAVSGILPS